MNRTVIVAVAGLVLGLGGATGIVLTREKEARASAAALLADSLAAHTEGGAAGAEHGAVDSLAHPVGDSTAAHGAIAAPGDSTAAHGAAAVTDSAHAGPANIQPDQLARMFAEMKPDAAARVLEQMNDAEIEKILSHLRERQAAPILSNLPPERAADISRLVIRSSTRSSR